MKHLVQAIFAKLQTIYTTHNKTAYIRFLGGGPELHVLKMDDEVASLRIDMPDRAYRCYINKHGAFDIDSSVYDADDSADLYNADRRHVPTLLRTIAEGLDLAGDYYGKVTTKLLTPFPPGSNPYNFDHVRQGVPLYGSTEAMFHSSNDGDLKELIIVNTRTGRRVEIDLSALN